MLRVVQGVVSILEIDALSACKLFHNGFLHYQTHLHSFYVG